MTNFHITKRMMTATTITSAIFCLVLAILCHAHDARATPPTKESLVPTVMLKIQQVAFIMTGNTRWESDEVYADSPSVLRTTLLGKPISETLTHGLASLEGQRNNTSPNVPMDFTVTVTPNDDGNFAIRLMAKLKDVKNRTIATVDATQYSVQSGGTYFVLPVAPIKGKQALITLKVTPTLLTEKQRLRLENMKNQTAPTIAN